MNGIWTQEGLRQVVGPMIERRFGNQSGQFRVWWVVHETTDRQPTISVLWGKPGGCSLGCYRIGRLPRFPGTLRVLDEDWDPVYSGEEAIEDQKAENIVEALTALVQLELRQLAA